MNSLDQQEFVTRLKLPKKSFSSNFSVALVEKLDECHIVRVFEVHCALGQLDIVQLTISHVNLFNLIGLKIFSVKIFSESVEIV